MRTALLVIACVIACAIPCVADEDNPIIFFKEGDKTLVIQGLEMRLDATKNECEGSCDQFYVFESGPGVPSSSLPIIVKGGVSDRDSHDLELHLDKAPGDISSLRVILKRLQAAGDGDPEKREYDIRPSVFLDPTVSKAIVYQSIRGHASKPLVKDIKVNVMVKDAAGNSRVLPVTVQGVEPFRLPGHPENAPPDGETLWLIFIDPGLPRGTKASLKVSGIDTFGNSDLTAKGTGKAEDFPKGRDDAEYYLKGQYIFNQTTKDQGSIDLKVERHFFSSSQAKDWWYKVEATVGSKSLDISQTGTVAAGRTWWLNVDPKDPKKTPWALSLSPTFQTDRDFKNRDLGADLTLEGKPGTLYKPLETERREFPDKNFTYGWWIVPKLAIESGWHLASSSDEVDGKSFERGVASVNLMWERVSPFVGPFATLRLTVDATARYLVQDEVLSDSGSVVKADKGYTPYLRAELAYDLGPVAVSIVHENGRLPPDFKRAHSTTVGVTVKF